MTSDAESVLQERVLETQIYNVIYRVEDARIFDEKTILAGAGTATNDTDSESSLTVRVAYEGTHSFSFSSSSSMSTDIPTTIRAGLPRIVQGNIKISPEVTTSFEWGRIITDITWKEASITVTAPARSRVRANYVAAYGRCNVPFSYTQRDKISDVQFVTTEHTDGIFNGANNYYFRFGEPTIEPL